MCFSEGTFQAYLDGELALGEAAEIRAHLKHCLRCRQKLRELEKNNLFAAGRLSAYIAFTKEGNLDLARSWQRFESACKMMAKKSVGGGEADSKFKLTWKGANFMFSRYKKAALAVALAAALAVSFSFGSVRSFAGNLLTVFRVERVQTITISPEDIAQLEKAFQEGKGKVDVGNLGKFEVSGKQAVLRGVSLAEAKNAVDFPLRLPEDLPGYRGPVLSLASEAAVNITLDVEKVNQLLKSLGSSKFLPEGLNGQTFTLRTPAAVSAEYTAANDQSRKIVIVQGRSPELAVPAGTDMAAIREVLLAVPVLPENLRRQVAAVSDWQHTFLIPNVEGSSVEVTVNGVKGVYIAPPLPDGGSNGSGMSGLIWQAGGVVYFVGGPGMSRDNALELAGKMR